MEPEITLEYVDQIVARCGRDRTAVIPILQAVHKQYRYLPEAALRRVCAITEITPATIESVATFFPQFRWRPAGKHTICLCDGTACHLKGAPAVYDEILKELGIGEDEDTGKDGTFTIQKVRCLGCCTLAPAVQIDGVTYGHVSADTVPGMLDDFLAHSVPTRQPIRTADRLDSVTDAEIRIGLGSCCVAGGSERIRSALDETLAAFDLNVRVKHVSCVGMCHQTPLMEVVIAGQVPRTYAKVQPEDVASLVLAHFPPRRAAGRVRAATAKWLERIYTGYGNDPIRRYAIDPAHAPVSTFLSAQRRIATEYCGEIDPTDLEEYLQRGGFRALRRCLDSGDTILNSCQRTAKIAGNHESSMMSPELCPEFIIEEIRSSGLRGRGGAGFATARKWEEVRRAVGAPKSAAGRQEAASAYVICNGDEGDPGAFMDRMMLESYPFRVIEGMLIASVAVGAHQGIFYIRAEYPLAVTRVTTAIEKCRKAGILGERVMGSPHAFDVEVREGAGAFVCGEETALIAALEGRRPTPRYRPPYPAREGLHGAPTLVNNVETLALVPWIIRHGADAFKELGTAASKGTKVFALAGKVQRGGLIEVPMGTTIRQIVEDIGGGVAAGRTFKAVQVGGPSGGCLPEKLADLPVDYETLTEAGAMMGSGGLVVLDDRDCIVEVSRYFLSFTQLESCGKCTPCRVGTKQMLEILARLCEGAGTKGDLDHLRRLAGTVKQHSLCGLGRTAPNPVLTSLAYFREEFEAHVEGRCPAHKCKALITYTITRDCIGCTKCAQRCPADAIRMAPYDVHEIDPAKCVRCGACHEVCPVHAVKSAAGRQEAASEVE
jgi:NADH-quinone oxidoreductase subunit F